MQQQLLKDDKYLRKESICGNTVCKFNSLEVFCEGSSIGSLGSVLDGRVLGGSGLLSGTFSTAI